MAELGTVVALIKSMGGADPAVIEQAVQDWLDDHPEATTTVQDGSITEAKLAQDVMADLGEIDELKEAIVPLTPSATSGDVGKFLKAKTVSGGKVTAYEFGSAGGGGSVDLFYVTPEDYGAVGDGETDDSQAVQDACDAGYEIRFGDNKTYFLGSTVEIDHDVHLVGGKNTVIKTATPSGGSAYNGIEISGTLKKTTTLTSNYATDGNTDNCNNKFTLSDMTGIEIGDIMVIEATDQHYHYARQYYYLGATLLITDTYDGHLYSCDSMPWDITNSQDVTVKIYSAPTVIVENIKFESSGFDGGNYKYLLSLTGCKNSTIRNCTVAQMDNGINIDHCVNTLVSNVSLSKCKYSNSLNGDGYGIVIDSDTNTIIERVLATCAQHAIAVTGHLPTINTFIRHCDLTAECRSPGLDTHEAIYNLVVEDCTLGTAALNGSAHINRCKIISNRRANTDDQSISIYGSQNPDWSKVIIENTEFEGKCGITISQSGLQTPVQSFDNVYGEIRIENCVGGFMSIIPTTNATILSNTINRMSIKNWQKCKEIYYGGTAKVKELTISDSSFTETRFINDHNSSHGVVTDFIEYLDVQNTVQRQHKVSVCRGTLGECVTLPENVQIQLSSNSQSAKYIVCGNNLASNDPEDYFIGAVSGSDGGTLSRSVSTGSGVPTLSVDDSGNLVYTQKNNSGSYNMYPLGLFYVKEPGHIEMSATLKNTGDTSGATFSPYIAVVNCKTGKLVSRYNGTAVQATAQGANISYEAAVSADCVAMCYFYCNSPVANAETTFEDMTVIVENVFVPLTADSIQPYEAKRRTGDGAVLSLPGVNNIMCSDLEFHVSFAADFVENPIGILPSGTGVSF